MLPRLALACALACIAIAPAEVAARPLSADRVVARAVNPVAALRPLPPGAKVVMPSSHDRNGGNVDGGAYTGPMAQSGQLPLPFIRREDGTFVIMEYDQPGCFVRLFMAGGPAPPAETHSFGNLQVFVDGGREPVYDAPVHELFEGRDPRYPAPLVGEYSRSSGGNWSMVPFCFRRSLKVRTTAMPNDLLGYWQANVLLVPPRTPVTPYDPEQSLASWAERLKVAGAAPEGPPAFAAEGDAPLEVADLPGRGLVRYLRFTVEPFDAATLAGLSLQVTTDGATRPQIDVPLGGLFGDSIETRRIDTPAFGMDPEARTGYLALPIPHRRGVRLNLSGSAAHVRVEGWKGRRVRRADTLFGEHHVEQAPEGLDTRVLEARGSGRLAALTFDDVDGGPATGAPPVTQRWLEGDERTFVDGARSPTLYGTGHEERFNGGYYYGYGAFTTPFGGAGPLGQTSTGAGRQSQYRVYGADAPLWSRRYLDLEEHGGGDEQPNTVAITTWSYRGPVRLRLGDRVVFGDPGSESAHRLRGEFERESLRAFFEGERDGNGTTSTIVVGGSFYPGPPAEENPEAVTADGIRFGGPIRLRMKVPRRHRLVMLRGLFDQSRPEALRVRIDGRRAGVWADPTRVPNPSKRWLEDDFALPRALTRGKRLLRLELAPATGVPEADLFGLRVLVRRR